MGIGDCELGIGDWAQSPIPNPQSSIPNPQNQIFNVFKNNLNFIFLEAFLIYSNLNYKIKKWLL